MIETEKHGGNIYHIAKQLGYSPKDIIDFSSNINPTVAEIDLSVDRKEIAVYADANYEILTETVALKYSVDSSEIAFFNGASAAIFALFEQLDFTEVTLYAPLYGEYKEAAKRYDKKINLINRRDDIWEKPRENSLVIFVNPSTPDGRLYDFKILLQEWQDLNCTVIMDESFLEFTQQKSLREEIKIYKNLYILQSFTKFYACAGLRVGAVFSHADNIEKLFSPMWQLSSVDVTLLLRLLNDKDHKEKSETNFAYYSQRLASILVQSQCFDEVYPSEANYMLVRTSRAHEIEEKLLKHKVMVRNCANFDFLDDNYLRFAVKDDKALDALQKALKACIE